MSVTDVIQTRMSPSVIVVVLTMLHSALQVLVEVQGLQEEPTARKGERWVHQSGHPVPGGMGTRDLVLPGSQGAGGAPVWLWLCGGVEQGSSVNPCFAGSRCCSLGNIGPILPALPYNINRFLQVILLNCIPGTSIFACKFICLHIACLQ